MAESARAAFLSYAREDTSAAQRIADALRAGGIEVWFDQSELRGGDAWDAKIKKQIQTCALFLPIISAQTQARAEGYFRLEWLLAAERTKLMGRSKAFLVPVGIDSTKEGEADVPEAFLSVQWTRLAGGETPGTFVERVRRLLGDPVGLAVAVEPGAPASARPATANDTAPAAAKRATAWLRFALVIAVGVVALTVWLTLRRVAPNSPVSPPLAGSSGRTPPPPVVTTTKSVAVLAFENLNRDEEGEPFSDGISDELMHQLGKVAGLTVKGRTSAFSFKGQVLADAEIGQKLGVAYVVNGSVQKAAQQVRIVARLVNAADGVVLWSDKFTEDAKDIFSLQDRIAGQIAEKLQLKLTAAPRAAKTVNPEAHRLVLLGRHYWNFRTPVQLARAEEAFKQAIELDPGFAQAHAGLADVCNMRSTYALQDGGAVADVAADVRRARAEAEQAVALDPNLSEALAALGYTALLEGRYPEAERQFHKAIALNPSYTASHAWLATLRYTQGNLSAAIASLESSVALDPLWSVNLVTMSEHLLYSGQPAQALRLTDQVLARRSDILVMNLGNRARALFALGRRDEAVESARLIHQNLDASPRRDADSSAVWVLRKAGLQAEAEAHAEACFKRLGELSQQRGLIFGALGRFAEALPYLERTPPIPRRRLYWDPMWDRWREDPRFQQLIEKLGCTAEYRTARAELARLAR